MQRSWKTALQKLCSTADFATPRVERRNLWPWLASYDTQLEDIPFLLPSHPSTPAKNGFDRVKYTTRILAGEPSIPTHIPLRFPRLRYHLQLSMNAQDMNPFDTGICPRTSPVHYQSLQKTDHLRHIPLVATDIQLRRPYPEPAYHNILLVIL